MQTQVLYGTVSPVAAKEKILKAVSEAPGNTLSGPEIMKLFPGAQKEQIEELMFQLQDEKKLDLFPIN